ncbi:MAG: YdcF family protein [Desulfarculus sp.]|nr:YdcF family protein [Desulfarculus sp.]
MLKKVVSRLLFPVELILGLGLAGLLLLGWRRRARWGLGLLWAAWLTLLLLSVPALTYLLLAPLEEAAGDYADPARLAAAGVEHIVVLGGGVGQGQLTVADRLHGASMLRLMEGLRLFKALPGAKLVISGGGHREGVTVGQAMRGLALELGLPASSLLLEDQSWDTEDQARLLAGLLQKRPFALVTSAYHMRRSLAFFKAHGLNPLPAPADFRTRGFRLDFDTLLPSTGSLHGAEIAFYEYLGHLWLKLKYLNGTPAAAPAPGGP